MNAITMASTKTMEEMEETDETLAEMVVVTAAGLLAIISTVCETLTQTPIQIGLKHSIDFNCMRSLYY